jgi:hypothetical protein
MRGQCNADIVYRIGFIDYKEKTRAGLAASDRLLPGQGVPTNG